MTITKIIEVILLQPGLLKYLSTYYMWHSFQEQNYITVCGVKLSYFTIYHSVLRAKLEQPKFSLLTHELDRVDSRLAQLIVTESLMYGFIGVYMPTVCLSQKLVVFEPDRF